MENRIRLNFIVIYISLVGLVPSQVLSFPQDNIAGKGKSLLWNILKERIVSYYSVQNCEIFCFWNSLPKFSDQVPKKVENDLPIKQSMSGDDQSSEVKTKVSIVIFVYKSKNYVEEWNLFNCNVIAK